MSRGERGVVGVAVGDVAVVGATVPPNVAVGVESGVLGEAGVAVALFDTSVEAVAVTGLSGSGLSSPPQPETANRITSAAPRARQPPTEANFLVSEFNLARPSHFHNQHLICHQIDFEYN